MAALTEPRGNPVRSVRGWRPNYTPAMGKPWPRIESRQIHDYRFFRLRQDTSLHPQRGSRHDFFVFEFPHWVNIIPLTEAEEVVFIRQFRHGTRELTLEVPGGTIDAGESPRTAALREMAEETGYEAAETTELGWVHPNPAIQTNRCWSFLARNVVPGKGPRLEDGETIEVEVLPLTDVPELLANGMISHGLVVAAFHLLNQHLRPPST